MQLNCKSPTKQRLNKFSDEWELSQVTDPKLDQLEKGDNPSL